MTWVTWSTVSADTPYRPLMTFETVEIETPASAATCCIVTRPRRDGPGTGSPSVPLLGPTRRPEPTTSFRDESSFMVNLFSVGPWTVRLPGSRCTGHRPRGPRAEARPHGLSALAQPLTAPWSPRSEEHTSELQSRQ